MIKARNKFKWLSVLLVLGSSLGRADIMDNDDDELTPKPAEEEPDTPTVPQKAPSKPGKTTKTPPKATDGNAATDEDEPAETPIGADGKPLRVPSPHPKDTKSSDSTTVIPPKNAKKAGKPAGSGGKPGESKAPVHFESRGLKGLREQGMVELLQEVVVTQDDMKLESDYAQVFFDEASHEVLKVIAQGNVRINGTDQNSGDHFRAVGDRAIFLNADRTIVLEGNAKLWRGDDSVIRSRKITYEMSTGWIRADRVAGEVQADSKTGEPAKPQAKPQAKPTEKKN